MKNFQAESKKSGDDYEIVVGEDLINKHNKIIDKNKKIPDIGINVDYIIEDQSNVVEYVEAKGGRPGEKKRPGALRTDNVKKAICNGALLKFKYPDKKYVIYFSYPPKPGSSSEEMIKTALEAKFIDEVRYLSYNN
jgi:hypothetical protein